MAEETKTEEKKTEEILERIIDDEKMLEGQVKERMKKLAIEDGRVDEIIEDIHIKGYSEVEIPITKKVKVVFKTLTGEEVSEINRKLSGMEGTMAYVSGEQGLNVLSFSLQSINGKSVGNTPDDKREYLKKQGEVFLNAYIAKYNLLRELIQITVQGEPIKKF